MGVVSDDSTVERTAGGIAAKTAPLTGNEMAVTSPSQLSRAVPPGKPAGTVNRSRRKCIVEDRPGIAIEPVRLAVLPLWDNSAVQEASVSAMLFNISASRPSSGTTGNRKPLAGCAPEAAAMPAGWPAASAVSTFRAAKGLSQSTVA